VETGSNLKKKNKKQHYQTSYDIVYELKMFIYPQIIRQIYTISSECAEFVFKKGVRTTIYKLSYKKNICMLEKLAYQTSTANYNGR
jgi:hypothetical protein